MTMDMTDIIGEIETSPTSQEEICDRIEKRRKIEGSEPIRLP